MRRALLALVLAAVLSGAAGAALALRHGSTGPPGLDLSTATGTDLLAGFTVRDLHPSAAPDQIPAIDRPLFDSPAEAGRLLPDTALVIGFEHAGESHAYPVDLLSLHEVVDDVVGGLPVAITWCPLCQSAAAFDRRVGGRILRFGVSGYLLGSNEVLFDRRTGSLWSQLVGGAITGRYRGTRLRTLPLSMETWGEWRRQHPRTRVLSIRRDRYASRFTHPYATVNPRGDVLSNAPYSDYLGKVATYFPRVVRGVRDSARVLGVVAGRYAKAYPLDRLRSPGLVDDTFDGVPVLLVYDRAAETAAAFLRRAAGRTLHFDRRGGTLVDRESHSLWSPASGRALAGPLAGEALPRLPTITSFWFAWRVSHPGGPVYLGPGRSG